MITAAKLELKRDADGKPEETRENTAIAFRIAAEAVRHAPLEVARDLNGGAVMLAMIATSHGWLSYDAAVASVYTAQADEQQVGQREAYGRHLDRLAMMVENATDSSATEPSAVVPVVAQRLFAGAQPHRFSKEIM